MLIISNEVWCNLSTPSSVAVVEDPCCEATGRRGTKGVGHLLSFTPQRDVVGNTGHSPPPAKRWSKIRVAKQQGEGGLRGWDIFCHSPPSVTWSVIPGRHPLQQNSGRRSIYRPKMETWDRGGGSFCSNHPAPVQPNPLMGGGQRGWDFHSYHLRNKF